MALEQQRRDSRQNNNVTTTTPRRQSRLSSSSNNITNNRSLSVSHRSAFETVDELDDIDRQVHRKASQVSIAVLHTLSVPSQGIGNNRDGRISRRVSRLPSQQSPNQGNINSAYDTVDELDDLDQKYRKASAVNLPSRRESRLASPPGKEVKAKEELYFKKRCTTTTKVLVILAIAFFLSTEVMVSIYLMELYKDPPPQVCHSDACINFGRILKSSINTSSNPCVDFYEYACGNFQRLVPYGERYRDFEDLINDELTMRMHDILTRLEASNQTKEDFEKKALQFHHLCMDLNASSVRESIVHVLQNKNISWSLSTLLKEAHQHGISALFHISRLPDSEHPRNDPFWSIKEGQLPLARFVYDSEKTRKLYRNFIKDLVTGLRKDVENSVYKKINQSDEYYFLMSNTSDYMKIVDFEMELAGVKHEQVYFKLSIKEFSISYPAIAQDYDLVQYFQVLSQDHHELNNATNNVSVDTVIILKNRDYFQTLNQQLGQLSKRDQAVYLGWRILFHYVHLMEDEVQLGSIIQGFWRAIGQLETESQSRWKKCARLAITSLPDAGLLLYSKAYYTNQQNKKIDVLLDKLTTIAVELVDKQTWLIDADKAIAKQKYHNLTRQLPYSEELYSVNETNLDNLYSKGIIEYDSFFHTLRTFQRVREHFIISGVYNTPIKFMDLLTFAIGADYRLESNNKGIIGVFPKTLVPPFFDNSFPSFVQYSLLGFLYARELAHVVDYEWFMLNKTGEANGGPSNSTFQQYHATLGYLLELYQNVSNILQLPGNLETLYEDSADQAAMRLSFRAYQDTIRTSNDLLLPGFPYDKYDFTQMFFLSFAQQFCLNDESVRIKDPLNLGFSHSRIRLTAMVQNSEEFDTAFHCGKGTSGQQLFQIPDPPRKLKYKKDITAKQIDKWFHWFDRKPGLPNWSKAW